MGGVTGLMIFWNMNPYAGVSDNPETNKKPRVWMSLKAFDKKGSWTYPYAGRVLAHEIGHVFGIQHTHHIDRDVENCECTSFDEKFSSFDGMVITAPIPRLSQIYRDSELLA